MKKSLAALLVLLVCVASGFFLWQKEREPEKPATSMSPPPNKVAATQPELNSKPKDIQYLLSAKDFVGFEKCDNQALAYAVDKLVMSGRKIRKEDGIWWIEPIKAEFMGLPVIAIGTGVCDANGSIACGWARYKALVVSKSFDQVRSDLIEKIGDDFSQELRYEETNMTQRPLLQYGESVHESILFCDSGWL